MYEIFYAKSLSNALFIVNSDALEASVSASSPAVIERGINEPSDLKFEMLAVEQRYHRRDRMSQDNLPCKSLTDEREVLLTSPSLLSTRPLP